MLLFIYFLSFMFAYFAFYLKYEANPEFDYWMSTKRESKITNVGVFLFLFVYNSFLVLVITKDLSLWIFLC